MALKTFYQYIVRFLRTKLSRVQLIMLIATFVGFTSGLLAVLIKLFVHSIQNWIQEIPVNRFAYLFFPAVGLFLSVFLIRHFFGGQIQKGIAMVLKAIAMKSSYIPLSHTYMHVVTSSLTVGLGGSVGLEAPIVATGSAVGSNISRISDLNYQERTLLIACGAAAGISAVFNAPIAGVIFAVEILLSETIVSYFIPYYLVLGVMAGFISLYYARLFKGTEKRMLGWKMNGYMKTVAGGSILALIYFVFPPLFGEGYNSVKMVANGSLVTFADNTTLFSVLNQNWGLIVFSGLIVILKPIAAGITIGSGGNGGNFAPSLFAGSYLGFFFSKLLNSTPWIKIPEGNFSLVGMAGVLSGVMYCPLTAIFLIAEITNGYELFIPLMIVSSLSFFIVKSYEPYSMDIKKLALEGQVFTHKKEKNILTSIRLEDMLHDKYESIGIDKKLLDLVEIVKRSEKNIFAVVDTKERFAGKLGKKLKQNRLITKENLLDSFPRPGYLINTGKFWPAREIYMRILKAHSY